MIQMIQKLGLGMVAAAILTACGNGEEPQVLSLDFSKAGQTKFEYKQDLTGTTLGMISEEKVNSESHAKGFVIIDVKKDETADLILSGIDFSSRLCCINGKPMEKNAMDLPPTTLAGLQKDGSFTSRQMDPAFNMLFRLPKKAIAAGQSVLIPMNMPIRVGEWDMDAKGSLKLTYTKNEVFEGRNCAVLSGNIDISEVKIPQGLKGEVKCNNKGKVIYYFDLDNRCFVKVDMGITISNFIRVDKQINQDLDTENNFVSKISLHLVK